MKLLVVSPDYASHALPMLRVASAWQGTVGDVVVATGHAVRPLVQNEQLRWTHLRLGRGSNEGVIEVADQPAGEDNHLQEFFDATRLGPVQTLRYQALGRRHDLLFEPDRVTDELGQILADERPDRVLVDHVAFGARLALHALGVEPATIVLGHPSALPVTGEVYGLPPVWPQAIRPSESALADLRAACCLAIEELMSVSEELLARRAPHRRGLGDLTSRPGAPTVYVYPQPLLHPDRALPAPHVVVDSMVRSEDLGDLALPSGDGPLVVVALGTFLSARDDVLAKAICAARAGGWRLALAHGSSDPAGLGTPPAGSLVARHLPQVALLQHADVIIHHGGNGSVTEAAAAGVPMVVLPFSTDQFAAAAAVERAGIGRSLAPNSFTADDLIKAVNDLLASEVGDRAAEVARLIRDGAGARAAVQSIVDHGRPVDLG